MIAQLRAAGPVKDRGPQVIAAAAPAAAVPADAGPTRAPVRQHDIELMAPLPAVDPVPAVDPGPTVDVKPPRPRPRLRPAAQRVRPARQNERSHLERAFGKIGSGFKRLFGDQSPKKPHSRRTKTTDQ
jgi:hypothetical protein